MSMPTNRIQTINGDFLSATDVLLKVLDITDGSALPPELRVVISNNVIVALVSTTEEAIRNAFSESLAIILESGVPFDRLRSDLQKANLEGGIALLSEQRRSLDWQLTKSVIDSFARCYSVEQVA